MYDLGQKNFTKLVRQEMQLYNQNIVKPSMWMLLKNLAYTKGRVYLHIMNRVREALASHFRWLTQLTSRKPLHPCVSRGVPSILGNAQTLGSQWESRTAQLWLPALCLYWAASCHANTPQQWYFLQFWSHTSLPSQSLHIAVLTFLWSYILDLTVPSAA